MAKSNEPIWWSLFSAGGMVAAMILPVLIIITGILVPFGLVDDDPLNFERIYTALSQSYLIKLILFIVIILPLFHWAHRFRFTLVDVGLKSVSTLISILCYGGAIAGTIIAAIIFLRI
ncbi:MAG TPA: fumarate reductase subunit D [Candidatus Marinimicrobia bacterium]|nr:fumarate reductase subunit D [Candidatus Neomarinimicrobiota bacterium]